MRTDAAIYQRVSDGTDKSVEQQNQRNEEAARSQGWSYTPYSDAVSASRFSQRPRPDWDRLVSDVQAGLYRYVILWEPSRGDRKVTTWAAFLDACRETDTRIYVTTHDRLYSMRNASDWKALINDGVDSAYESEKTSLRVRRDLTDAAARGEPHGRIPYGYTRRYERVDGRPKPLPIQYPHPVEAPVAREIITRIAKNDSVSGLLADLAERGITTRAGKPWAHSSLTNLVLNGVCYIGKRRHNGGPLLPGNWEPLVDDDVYWAAVTVLSDPARKRQAETRGGIRPGASKWLLSYIARCDVCGSRLGMKNRQGVPHYKCSARTATHAYAPVEWMDWLIGEAVVRWCAQERVYAEITAGDDNGALAAQAEADALQSELDEWATSGISARAYKLREEKLLPAIAAAEERARVLAVPAELRELVGASRREKDIAGRWQTMELTARRSVIRKVAAPTLRPSRGYGLLNPRRVSVNFTIPMPTRDYSLDPLLPLPACLAR